MLSLQTMVKHDISLRRKHDQSEANMVFGIRANPSFRAVNLFIYLLFTAAVKLIFFSHLLRYVNICKHEVYFLCKGHQSEGNISFVSYLLSM